MLPGPSGASAPPDPPEPPPNSAYSRAIIDFVPSVSSTNASVLPAKRSTKAGSPRDSSSARPPAPASQWEVASASARALRLPASSTS